MNISKLLTAAAITLSVVTANAQTATTKTATTTQKETTHKAATHAHATTGTAANSKHTEVEVKKEAKHDAAGKPVESVKHTSTEKHETKMAPATHTK